MVTDVLFPIYSVLVEDIFGSVGLAVVGVGIVITLILLLCRTSSTFLIYWLIFYFMVMGTFYIGALALIFAFLFGFAGFVYNIIKIFWGEG